MPYLPEPSSEEKAIVWSTLEIVAQLIPWIGPALATAVGNVGRYQWESAMEATVTALKEQANPQHLVDKMLSDERFALAFVEAIRAASRTSLSPKRAAIGRALSEMCDAQDPQAIDDREMRLKALEVMDIPHFRALRRIIDAEDVAYEDSRREAVANAASAELAPIRAALLQVGALEVRFGWGDSYGLTDFGRRVLAEVEQGRA